MSIDELQNEPDKRDNPLAEGASSGCAGCAVAMFPAMILIGICSTWPPFRYVAYPALIAFSLLAVYVAWRTATEGETNFSEHPEKAVAAIVALLIAGTGVFMFNGVLWDKDFYGEIEQKNKRDQEKKAASKVTQEFRKILKFESPYVAVAFREGGVIDNGELTLTNDTKLPWKSVYIIVNPENEGVLDIPNFLLSEPGFRAPSNPKKTFTDCDVGETIRLTLDEFVHTESGEKFSSERYRLKRVFVKAVIEYKGQEFTRSCNISAD